MSGEEEEEIRDAFDLFVDKDELGAHEIETGDVKKALRCVTSIILITDSKEREVGEKKKRTESIYQLWWACLS